MNEQREQLPLSSNILNHLFTRLNPLDVEQFYTAYQLWITQQRIYSLHMQIDELSHALADNTKLLEQTHPPALALAALARLQSNGVSDIDLLDRMLERGEEWLDRTMQHLDYCERIDVISGDYTKWCEHALEGAYDWIDSMQEISASSSPAIEAAASTTIVDVNDNDTVETRKTEATNLNNDPLLEQQLLDEATEELFLQKLMSDESNEGNEITEANEGLENVGAGEPHELANEQDTDVEASLSMLAMKEMTETTLKIAATSIQQSPAPTAPQEQPPAPAEEHIETQQVEVITETDPSQQDTEPEAVESTPVLEETRVVHAAHATQTAQAKLDMLMPVEEGEHFEDTILPEPLPRKRGVWRTLLATLFHI